MEDEHQEEPQTVDRRSGSGSGKKAEEPAKPAEAAAETPESEAPKSEERPEELHAGAYPAPSFLELTQMFFLQAMISIEGGMDQESGERAEPDLDLARHHIGILELLTEKTKGNLGEVEGKYLSECLHQARLAFVAKAKAK